MSFRQKLVIALVLVALPFIASAVYFHYTHFIDDRNAALAEQRETARLLGRSVEVLVQGIVSVQRSAGQALTVSHWRDVGAQQHYITSVLASTPSLEHMALTDASGVIIEASPFSLKGKSVADSDYFRRIRSGASWTVSGLSQYTLDGNPGTVVATAIRDSSGDFLGVVVSDVNEARLGTMTNLGTGNVEKLVILDQTGQLVFASGEGQATQGSRKWADYKVVREALMGETASVTDVVLPDGTPVVGVVTPIPTLGWAAGAFVPREKIIAPVVLGTLRDVGVTIVALTLAIVLAVLLSSQLIKQVTELAGVSDKLGLGELHVRAGEPNTTELAGLARTMNRMANSIEERDSALRTALAQEQKAAREASALYGISSDLIGSPRLQDRIEALAEGMALLAGVQVCIFYLIEGERLVVGATHGLTAASSHTFSERSIDVFQFDSQLPETARQGQPMVLNEPHPMLDKLCIGMAFSALIIPVRSDNKFEGLGVLYTPGRRTEFSEDTIAIETDLAQLASKAVAEARSFEREQRIATVLQRTILGRAPHNIGNAEIAAAYYPVLEEAEIGGDFYDVTALPDGRLGLLIADVSGKGLRAATSTAMVKYLVEGFSYYNPDPSEVLAKTNGVVSASNEEWGFITAFYGVLDSRTGAFTFANAGHPHPALLHERGGVEWVEVEPGPPLGVDPGIGYSNATITLSPGDTVLCYTDGVIEARTGTEMFGMERLAALLGSLRNSPDEIVDKVYQTIYDYVDGRVQDDIALVAVKVSRDGKTD